MSPVSRHLMNLYYEGLIFSDTNDKRKFVGHEVHAR